MSEAVSYDRDKFDIFRWPEFEKVFGPMAQFCLLEGEVSRTLKSEAFTVLSLASGCRNCQAHGGYSLHLAGVSAERIQALWDFERSDLFSPAERAVLTFALAAGSSPNGVGPEHFATLREFYSDKQIGELMAVVAMSGFLNRYCDTMAYVTDQESIDWAKEVLEPVGWDQGKHVGSSQEQASDFPDSARPAAD